MSEKISIVQIGGNVEQALKGEYVIDVKQILSEAWQTTLRGRLSINLGLCFVILLGMLVSYVASHYLGGIENIFEDPQASMILNVVVTVAIWPFIAGIEMMGLLHAVGVKTQPKLVFAFLRRGSWVAICALLTTVFTSLGFQLLILPGIFLAVVLSLTIPLVVEKQLSPMKSVIVSVQALRFKWFPIMLTYLALFMSLMLLLLPVVLLTQSQASPFAIGLFLFGMSYLAPWYYNVKGILYREIFGVQIASKNPENVDGRGEPQDSEAVGNDKINDSDDTFSA